MSFPLENARLCLDCDTVFDEPRCPSCSSESFFPLSRWVRPAGMVAQTPRRTVAQKARNTSLVLGGAGIAYALWKLFSHNDSTPSENKKRPPEK